MSVLRAYNMCWPVLRITVVVLLTCRGLSHVRVQLYIMMGHVVCGEEFVTATTPRRLMCCTTVMMYILLYYCLRTRCDGSRRVVFIEFWIFSILCIIIFIRVYQCRRLTARVVFAYMYFIMNIIIIRILIFFPSHPPVRHIRSRCQRDICDQISHVARTCA